MSTQIFTRKFLLVAVAALSLHGSLAHAGDFHASIAAERAGWGEGEVLTGGTVCIKDGDLISVKSSGSLVALIKNDKNCRGFILYSKGQGAGASKDQQVANLQDLFVVRSAGKPKIYGELNLVSGGGMASAKKIELNNSSFAIAPATKAAAPEAVSAPAVVPPGVFVLGADGAK